MLDLAGQQDLANQHLLRCVLLNLVGTEAGNEKVMGGGDAQTERPAADRPADRGVVR